MSCHPDLFELLLLKATSAPPPPPPRPATRLPPLPPFSLTLSLSPPLVSLPAGGRHVRAPALRQTGTPRLSCG